MFLNFGRRICSFFKAAAHYPIFCRRTADFFGQGRIGLKFVGTSACSTHADFAYFMSDDEYLINIGPNLAATTHSSIKPHAFFPPNHIVLVFFFPL